MCRDESEKLKGEVSILLLPPWHAHHLHFFSMLLLDIPIGNDGFKNLSAPHANQ